MLKPRRERTQPHTTLLLLLCITSSFFFQPTAAFGFGFGSVTDIIRQLDDLSIFRFRFFATDFYNLFWGKRKLQCALKMQRLIDATGPSLEGGYRDDSIMILPEAGPYVGNDAILEYIHFADSQYSPYLLEGPKERGQIQTVVGYDGEGQCEFHWHRMNAYSMDADYVGGDHHFVLPVLTKGFLDYEEEYLKAAHVFYSKPFLLYFFGELLSTRQVAEFVCNDALGSQDCIDIVGPPPVDCVDRFQEDLPLTDPNDYVDGNSQSCRILHATFVPRNPAHCAHVTLSPSDQDTKGFVKCSASYQLKHSRFFSDTDMEDFYQFQRVRAFSIIGTCSLSLALLQDRGIDPSMGYKPLSSIDAPLL